MDGIIFYWVCWALWISAAFFMRKSSLRTLVSFYLLILMICAEFHAVLPIGEATGAFFLLWAAGIGTAVYSGNHRSFRFVLAAGGISAGYAGLKLMQMFDPVWFAWSPFYMLFIAIFGASFAAGRDYRSKISLFVLGSCYGEMLYEWIILPVSGQALLGRTEFLDFMMLGAAGCCLGNAALRLSKAGSQSLPKQKVKQSRIV
ncbi:hypothetical protein GKZ89_02135 [Bacillus mangrovi]|uniref:Uncharacterized protein n=1 Tax=Metabacillus mangrovi TaxID=1491830 RepID=A0A7X2S1W8_9BACI|nr:hypothetical protein [Metabacillus mangrovi]MTH52189.1 hypothetical protein [Metabacillus mangrovi]